MERVFPFSSPMQFMGEGEEWKESSPSPLPCGEWERGRSGKSLPLPLSHAVYGRGGGVERVFPFPSPMRFMGEEKGSGDEVRARRGR
jgi:hypothetical protein